MYAEHGSDPLVASTTIQCRYDRPPLVLKGWAKGKVAVLGDAAHPMMPNLGQGGCQAMEDGYRLAQVGRQAPDSS